MTAPFVPRAVVSRFMYDRLGQDAGVRAALGVAGLIVPDEEIPAAEVLTLAQTFAGGASVAKRLGAPIAQVQMLWDLTGWAPVYSREATEPLMLAVMAALIGAQTRGQTHAWSDPKDGRAWAIDCDFDSEVPVPLDVTSPQVWAPVRHRYVVTVRPRA